ncbi:unnamed protein product [Sphagnum jensenii]|uniref:DUF1664 domain-containing protein n=1 Tax=Sphagnum jensenii TaxID=128206 RepID=A0ABP1BC83_9BRYO
MAMQSSLGASKVIILLGAGLAGSVLVGNSRISDILSDLSKVLAKHLKEEGDSSGEGTDTAAALTAQVRRLSQELRQLASSSRAVTVVNANPSSTTANLSTLVLPVAVIGAAGYGYLWWKGLSWGDVMYVTRKSMSNAVSSVSKQLENVSAALSSTKKHLTQRLEVVTKTLDDSLAVQGLIKDHVFEVRGEVERSRAEIENVQRLVEGLEVKIDEVQGKQDFANQGILFLCRFLQSLEMHQQHQPELPQGFQAKLLKSSNLDRTASAPAVCSASVGLKELQFISETLESSSTHGPQSSASEIASIDRSSDIKPSVGLTTPSRSFHRRFSVNLGLTQSLNRESLI